MRGQVAGTDRAEGERMVCRKGQREYEGALLQEGSEREDEGPIASWD